MITDLSYTKNKKRVNIEINEKFAFSVEENTIIKFGLYKGKSLTIQEQEEIISFDIIEYLTRKAYDLIGRRQRSRKEVQDYLAERSRKLKFYSAIDDEDGKKERQSKIIQIVLARLDEKKVLDDKGFARMLVDQRARKIRKSKKEIERDLIKYGVKKQDYEKILEEVFDQKQQKKTIESLIERKQNSLKIQKLPEEQQKEKITEFLLRKGFTWEEIKQNFVKNN